MKTGKWDWLVDGLLLLAIVTPTLLLVFPWIIGRIAAAHDALPEQPYDWIAAYAAIASTLVAVGGVVVAIRTFNASAAQNRHAQRKQHTITILLEIRISEEFQKMNRHRKVIYPPGQDIDPALFYPDLGRDFTDGYPLTCRRSGAEALVFMLNYYEFLAAGLKDDDLDEPLLKKTIRGLMCRLVDDARFVIQRERELNVKTFENLVWLYDSWRDPEATNSKGVPNERPIGP